MRQLILILLFAMSVWGTDYYVRPLGGTYGDEDGTSYANAYDGFADIVWATVDAGDGTLFVAGTHRETCTVGASGEDGVPIIIQSCTIANGASTDDAGIINGTDIITTWTQCTGAEILLNPGFETAGGGGADVFGTWSESVAGASTINDETVNQHSESHACRCDVDASANSCAIEQTVTLSAETNHTISFWYYNGTIDKQYAWRFINTSGNFTLQPNGTWNAGTGYNTLGYVGSWTQVTVSFTTLAYTTYKLTFQRLGAISASASHYFDDVSIKQAVAAYSATLAQEPEFVWYDGTLLTENDGATTGVGANEWDWAANTLYVNVGEDPDDGTLEASQRDEGILNQGHDYITIDGLKIEKVEEEGIYAYLWNDDNDNWIIQNCTIENYGENGIRSQGGDATTNDNWVIQDNTIGDGLTQVLSEWMGGITLRGVGGAVVRRNTVNTNGNLWAIHTNTSLDEGAGVISDDVQIYENDIEDCITGIVITYTTNALVYNNHIHDGLGAGIAINFESDGAIVYYNLIENLGEWGAGVSFNGIDVNSDSDDGFIYNNTVYKVHGSCCILEDDTDGCDGWYVKNNIFDASQNGTDEADNSNPVYIKVGVDTAYISNNCYYARHDNIVGNYKGTERALADWLTDSGDANSLSTDPLMTNAGSADFTLKANSPCIDAGINLGTTYMNSIKPSSTWPSSVSTSSQYDDMRWDIGAYRWLKLGGMIP